MPAITQRRSLTAAALEHFLASLGEHFHEGLTLYLTPASLHSPLLAVPQEAQEGLADLVQVAAQVEESETGAVFFWGQETLHVVLPPFPLQQDEYHRGFDPSTLSQMASHPYVVGVVLLRLGRYAVGVVHGNTLLASKTDTRYVKGRHRAGGSSAMRFQRIREKQVQELFNKVCGVAQTVLTPYEDSLDFLLFGGERHVLQDFRKTCPYLARFANRTLQRVLETHEPRRAELERMPLEVRKSRVLSFGVTTRAVTDKMSGEGP